jgi:ATP-dependent helicase HrpA
LAGSGYARAEQGGGGGGRGDVLLFMPGERDIRETRDLLEGRGGRDVEVIPLFGRLSAGEQERVFARSNRRKIVIATNIAETSLTIPGIRYVIDTGLARVSRYNPRTRTKRLPIEPVSQSSANQRRGRAGRVQDGVCIRLYSEEDFAQRPPHTQPELQRANLAEVILRMKAFQLGDIETFPFLDPPTPAAIAGGYKLLEELGACDADKQLTALGQDLARLPIDPTLGRMLLQSQREHASRELLIIAAGLSIQDPRERPLDQKDAAAAAHRRFADPQSDFLALLNIWNACHEEWEKLRTQNQRRKFCRTHFLSYVRMREWQDLHAQLHEALEDVGLGQTEREQRELRRHSSLHLERVARTRGHSPRAQPLQRPRKPAADNFPRLGAVRADGQEARGDVAGARPEAGPEANSQPQWMVAGEIVETSQLFARTVAGVDPLWIVQLAPHLCQAKHEQPQWNAQSGRVVADERLTLYGLEIHRRRVAYGNIAPDDARRVFIQSALVEEQLFPDSDRNREQKEGRGQGTARGNPRSRALLETVAPDRAWPPR